MFFVIIGVLLTPHYIDTLYYFIFGFCLLIDFCITVSLSNIMNCLEYIKNTEKNTHDSVVIIFLTVFEKSDRFVTSVNNEHKSTDGN